jgi:hypothetical protein
MIRWYENRYLEEQYRVNPDYFGHLRQESLLKVFGYRTGNNAPSGLKRIKILEDFLQTELPIQWPHRNDWHKPNTRKRLNKMISHIEWVADMMRLQDHRDCTEAIEQRASDIKCLRNLYPYR